MDIAENLDILQRILQKVMNMKVVLEKCIFGSSSNCWNVVEKEYDAYNIRHVLLTAEANGLSIKLLT